MGGNLRNLWAVNIGICYPTYVIGTPGDVRSNFLVSRGI